MTTSKSEPREMTASELLKHLKVYNKAARAEANLRHPNHAVVGMLLGEAAYDAIENLQATLEAKQAELDACSQRVEELKLSVREAVTNKSIYLEHKIGEVEQENDKLKAECERIRKHLGEASLRTVKRNLVNAQLQRASIKMREERDKLKARVAVLESALKSAKGFVDAYDSVGLTRVQLNKALAQKDGGV